MHLIDTHCHLDFTQFDHDRDRVLQHCLELGVKDIVVPAVTAERWPTAVSIFQSSAMLHLALGLHPMFMQQHQAKHIDELRNMVSIHHPIAIGEIGLDFYLNDHDKQRQIELFTAQLTIAEEVHLPVLLHIRKAHDHAISLLKQHTLSGGIVHAFNGSIQQAKQYQQLGFVFGIGGAITNPNATRLRQLISKLPLDSLVLETDAPDMSLFNHNEERNSPENIPKILASLADIRSETYQELAMATYNNSRRVLKL